MQNRKLRQITNFFWYVRKNLNLHTVEAHIERHTSRYSDRLLSHSNLLARRLIPARPLRRLKTARLRQDNWTTVKTFYLCSYFTYFDIVFDIVLKNISPPCDVKMQYLDVRILHLINKNNNDFDIGKFMRKSFHIQREPLNNFVWALLGVSLWFLVFAFVSSVSSFCFR